MKKKVNHPNHYTQHPSGVECIDIALHMDFCLGCAFKYLWRYDHKGKPKEDLEKCKWYLNKVQERGYVYLTEITSSVARDALVAKMEAVVTTEPNEMKRQAFKWMFWISVSWTPKKTHFAKLKTIINKLIKESSNEV